MDQSWCCTYILELLNFTPLYTFEIQCKYNLQILVEAIVKEASILFTSANLKRQAELSAFIMKIVEQDASLFSF